MKLSKACLLVGCCLGISYDAVAEIKLNGFASIRGGIMFDKSDEQGQLPYGEDLTFKDESLFAIQATASKDKLSATVQLLAEGINDFDVEARWAYISYQINDQHKLNAGRLINRLYYQSEYENVGYTHNYSRLPKSVYQRQDYNTIEGLSLNSEFYVSGFDIYTSVILGSWEGQTFLSSTNSFAEFSLDKMFALNLEVNKDWWKVFLGGSISEVNFSDFDSNVIASLSQDILNQRNSGITLKDQNGQIKSAYQPYIDAVGWHEKSAYYFYSGFGIDYNDWILDFEYIYAGIYDSSDAVDESYYVALGRRFGDFVVTLHTEQFKQDKDFSLVDGISDPDLSATGVFIENLFGQRKFDMTVLSVRYDFHPSAAFKLDYFSGDSHISNFNGMSFGIDMVF